MPTTRRATVDGHLVELELDQKLLVVNRMTLRVDGAEVDRADVFHGDKTLRTTLADGATIEVQLHSDLVGELSQAQVRVGEGTWQDLV